MKTRNGFVSNSSSSSFVCAVTGDSYEGYDGEYEVTCACCENGHEFNGEYALPINSEPLPVEEMRAKLIANTLDRKLSVAYQNASDAEIREWYADEYSEDSECEDWGELPAAACPICMFQYGMSAHLLAYLMQKCDTNEQQLLDELKAKFGDYTKFFNSLDDRMKAR